MRARLRAPLRRALAGALLAGPVFALVVAHQAFGAQAVSCSVSDLIGAITTANATSGGQTLQLAAGCSYTLTTANNTTEGGTGLPVVTGNITIQGNGATIARSLQSGTAAFRIFDVASGGTLSISGLTISNGLANAGQQGGGGIMSHGALTVTASTFTGNSAPSQTGTSGGAINGSGTTTITQSTFMNNSGQEGGGVFNQASATITDSTFTNNTGTIYGGGALLNAAGSMTVSRDTFVGNTGPGGGAIDNDTTLNINDSTFYGNSAGSTGGGAIDNFGTTTIVRSTFAANSSPYGANLLNYGSYYMKLTASIVANGTGGPNCASVPITDGGYNIDTGSSCAFTASHTSVSNTDPQLGPLASNGGPTQTMALPASSPAVDLVPTSAAVCAGTDQRGVSRPQGSGCDVGAYELVRTSGDTTPPTAPTGLTVTGTTSTTVSLSWSPSTDDVGVTGYTVYRDGNAVGSTGGANATSFTDVTAPPASTLTYTVRAFDGSGNVSAASAPVVATTGAAASMVTESQAGVAGTGSKVSSTTLALQGVVHSGDLLVGWFGQYDASGQVRVADDVNGSWTRVGSGEPFKNGHGDIALYIVQNARAAATGVTVTISAAGPTYLQGAAADYGGVATSGGPLSMSIASANSSTVDSGSTAAVPAGSLVIGDLMTGGSPGSASLGSSQGVPFTLRAATGSGSIDASDVLSAAAGPQGLHATLSKTTDWYAVAAVFAPASGAGPGPSPSATPTPTPSPSPSPTPTPTPSPSPSPTPTPTPSPSPSPTSTPTSSPSVSPSPSPTPSPSPSPSSSPTAGHVQWRQAVAASTGSRVASLAITLPQPVGGGDLLVGWFGQYDSTGQVKVSDPVHGAWTRAPASLTFSNGGGDIALFYVQNAAAAPAGLAITVSGTTATYLQGTASDYSGMAAVNAFDTATVRSGNSATVSGTPTSAATAGELVVGGIMTGGSPSSVTAGSSNGQPFLLRAHTGSGSVDIEDLLANAGPQATAATLGAATDWYCVTALFRPA